jgi:hypothetical protein
MNNLTNIVLHALNVAKIAPTPAFNMHDHFQLAGALVHANTFSSTQMTMVEVGSFGGHTAIFQAAVLKQIGHGYIHAIDATNHYGLTKYVKDSKLDNIVLHINPVSRIKWNRPVHVFFEDSK